MRVIDNPRARTVFLVCTFATLLAGDAWRYTIGWTGFAIVVGLLAVASIALLIAQRDRWRLGSLPYPLIAFLVLCALSIAWSFYPGASALGTAVTLATAAGGIAVAVTYTWPQILRGLGMALRLVLGLSLVFEFVVATIIRRPVLPPVPEPGIDYSSLPEKIPLGLFWSRNELFEVFDGGKIQGIVGNSTLLSFVALVGVIVFTLQLADRTVKKRWGLAWLAVAVACFVFSRSATNIIGLVVVAAVAAAILLIRRARTPRQRTATHLGIVAVAVAAVAIATTFSGQLLSLLGKSPDLTNRTDIWQAVIDLAQQRPVFGWGWVSYWVPWVAPFDGLANNNGIQQLHAHNAWLDVWLQLGILGLIVFGALVLSTFARSWALAADRPQSAPTVTGRYTALTMLPLLLLTALVVQSFAESRILVEFGLFALVLLAAKTKWPESVKP